ncbi:hypothetical protein ScPMuIL_008164 [Solemya velum]
MLKPKWNFRSLGELHPAANVALKDAMFNERSKRWRKAAENYRRLFWLIDRKHLPNSYEPPSSYPMLLYELHYHLGVAYQHMGEDRRAVDQYTRAIAAVSVPKNGCMAGCLTNSCLMTPIYCRRAFAHTRSGNVERALADAEKAVVLDSRNPDVYCVRALVNSSQNEGESAICDLDKALSLNPEHTASLVVRDVINRPLAAKLMRESDSYTDVDTFNHPHIMEFYEKLLYTACVPHTITRVNLKPDKPDMRQLGTSHLCSGNQSHRSIRGDSSCPPAFRSGTPNIMGGNSASLKRRRDYSEAIRKSLLSLRPMSASEFFANRIQANSATARLHAIMDAPAQEQENVPTRRRPSTVPAEQYRSMKLIPEPEVTWVRQKGTSSKSCRSRTTDYDLLCLTRTTPEQTEGPRSTITTCNSSRNKFILETPSSYTIPVFQPVNVDAAPRMYYKPWKGDKLPVSDVKRRTPAPAFY